MNPRKHLSLPVFIAGLAICSIFLVMNRHHYPVLDGDSFFFLPFAINYANGSGLVNTLWHPPQVWNPAHPWILTWHGFLCPMVLGSLAPSATYEGVRTAMALLWVVAFILFAVVIYRSLRLCGATEPWVDVVTVAALVAFAGLVTYDGRPELLVSFLVTAGMASALFAPLRWHWLILGPVVGCLAATSPASAIGAAPLLGIYAGVRLPLKRVLLFLIQSGAAAAAAFGICIWRYPFTLKAWLTGLSLHARVAMPSGATPAAGMAVLRKLQEDPALFPFVLLLIVSLLIGAVLFVNKRRRIGSIFAVSVFAAATVGYIYYFWGRSPNKSYYLVAFSPVMIWLIACGGAMIAEGRRSHGTGRCWPFYLPLCASLFFASIGFIRAIAVFPFFLQSGMPYEVAQRELRALVAQGEVVEVSGGLFSLTEDYSKVRVWDPFPPFAPRERLLFVQQVNRGAVTPPGIAGYTLVKNAFESVVPRIFGVKIANNCRGYNFAIYRRDDATPTP